MATFKARARTVEMLGRQQIAGIPTAISELFKNSHDAYASRVRADYFEMDRVLWLRDDGIGMSAAGFRDRWLVIGTESKLGRRLPVPPGMRKRPILGEKGIGRLAVASIGPALLVLSRPRGTKGKSPSLTIALIHWGLFELPGINLDEIDIPVRTWNRKALPGREQIEEMAGEILETVNKVASVTRGPGRQIAADLSSLELDPEQLDARHRGPSLASGGHGTQFLIAPTDESLDPALTEEVDGSAPSLIGMLIGFSNTWDPESPKPRIATSFFVHPKDEGRPVDVIGSASFFTKDEYKAADHRIEGTFDEKGTFDGTVSVYGEKHAWTLAWTGNQGNVLDCGPFSFRLAVVQGSSAQSKMPTSDWGALTTKLRRFGGLYIYRDDIRVLPYGRSDFDFIGLEQERSKNIARAFFSYRRMFGGIELDGDVNEGLREKAGREGFIDNRAYRQFRSVLSNFFAQAAREFFYEGSDQGKEFVRAREELSRRASPVRSATRHLHNDDRGSPTG